MSSTEPSFDNFPACNEHEQSISILVVGSTGFLASYLLPLLCLRGYQLFTLSRSMPALSCPIDPAHHFLVDLNHINIPYDGDTLRLKSSSFDVVIVLSSVLHAPTIISLLSCCNPFFIVISTTGIYTSLSAPTRLPRLQAELLIKNQTSNYVILRPNMISGGIGDRNISLLCDFIKKYHVMLCPLFGGGLVQPIYVKDLARIILVIIGRRNLSISKSYNIGGAYALKFSHLVRMCALNMGVFVFMIPVPAFIIRFLLLLPAINRFINVSDEQILRLLEPKSIDNSNIRHDFAFLPSSYDDMLANIRIERVVKVNSAFFGDSHQC